MDKKLFFLFMVLLMVNLAVAKDYYYQDEKIGLVKISIPETFWERVKLYFEDRPFFIAVEKATIKIGDKNIVTVGVEIPDKDVNGKTLTDADINKAVFVWTFPDGHTSVIDLKPSGLHVSQSGSPFTFEMTPLQSGTYKAHYIVMRKEYPTVLVKEVTEFNVVSGQSVNCQKESITEWKFLISTLDGNGKIYNQNQFSYDGNCKRIESQTKTYYKTECNAGFLIIGSSQSFSEGQKKCEKQEEIAEDSIAIGMSEFWTIENNVCVLRPTGSGFNTAEECNLALTKCENQDKECDDGSIITAFECKGGELVSTENKCNGEVEGNGEVSLFNDLFDLKMYGYYTYSLIASIFILVLVIVSTKKRRK